jgi:hypothetical protein
MSFENLFGKKTSGAKTKISYKRDDGASFAVALTGRLAALTVEEAMAVAMTHESVKTSESGAIGAAKTSTQASANGNDAAHIIFCLVEGNSEAAPDKATLAMAQKRAEQLNKGARASISDEIESAKRGVKGNGVPA